MSDIPPPNAHEYQVALLVPTADLLPGYRLVRSIGEGGSATVYEAEHRALRKRVAVKLLKAAFANDAGLLERTRVEAQALAKLRSPHLVDVSDLGQTADGRAFFVMELLHGCSLRDELERRRLLSPPEAIELTRQLLAGLATVHEAGLVHRDIKVENLFLCDIGGGCRTLKILDFGIAKVMPGSPGLEPSAPTEQGAVIGTPRFMSPEQAEGLPVDCRTDVYGAGLVLFQLLAGRDPFSHVLGWGGLLEAHISESPRPPSVHASAVHKALDEVVMRALAKTPGERFASAAEFSAALAQVNPPLSLRVDHAISTRWLALAVAIVFTSAVVSVSVAVLVSRLW